ncbi:hypothetical protein AUP68_04153 [Ilyonectria robusta]
MSSIKESEIESKAKHEEFDYSNMNPEHGARLTRSVLFKTDTRVLPCLALLFLCSFLDRTNVGNAKIIGMEKDLGLSNLQYSQGLAVFQPCSQFNQSSIEPRFELTGGLSAQT